VLKLRVREYERALHFRHGDYRGVLGPGRYFVWSRLVAPLRDRYEVVNLLESSKFAHPMLDVMLGDPKLASQLQVVDLAEGQRAIVWRDGRILGLFGPGRHAFWNWPRPVTIEVFEVSQLRFTHPQLEAVLAQSEAKNYLEWVEVDPNVDALLIVNGEFAGRLAPGKHAFWKGAGRVRIVPVDRREQVSDVAGQEIMTSDKVTLRVNLLVSWQVVDAVKAVTTVSDYAQAIYREAQLVLRAAIGTRKLDDLLADKEAVGGEVRQSLAARAAELGVQVRSVGLKDIVLPGDMKAILNQVIEAEKRAQAEGIRRREETASARSQANTARLLAENPVLARMKELEALQQIVAGSKATFVFGPSDIAEQVRRLVAAPEPEK
jgi:regulator of protease activity HflC (stomatin/prohibitin superfamily)